MDKTPSGRIKKMCQTTGKTKSEKVNLVSSECASAGKTKLQEQKSDRKKDLRDGVDAGHDCQKNTKIRAKKVNLGKRSDARVKGDSVNLLRMKVMRV